MVISPELVDRYTEQHEWEIEEIPKHLRTIEHYIKYMKNCIGILINFLILVLFIKP